MLANFFILAFAVLGCLAGTAPSKSEPILDALAAHHNIATQDQSYSATLPHVLGKNVVVKNNPIHYTTGFVGTPAHPVSTGQIINKHVETFALAGQQHKAQGSVVKPHVETTVFNHAVQVPVQTMQTVHIPSVQYHTVQVPVQIQKEFVEVEKPVLVPQPVRVESPPKPFVKEAIYARPFQVSQKYVKTRITPVKGIEIPSPAVEGPGSKPAAPKIPHDQQSFVDYTVENLYYTNRKQKVVTRFIKIEEYNEAETTDEVGVYYSYGSSGNDGGNFDLKVTRIFEVDEPMLVKNLTSTSRISKYRSPIHVINEYVNDHLVHSFYAGNPYSVYGGHNASESHFIRFHPGLFHSTSESIRPIPTKSGDQFLFNKYTEYLNGQQVEIEERTYTLPGGQVLFVEKRIRAVGDASAFPVNIEPVPSFSTIMQNGQGVLKLTLTYDSTLGLAHGKYGVASSERFASEFASFMDEFKKHVSAHSVVKREIATVPSEEVSRKKRSAEAEPFVIPAKKIVVNGTSSEEVSRKKRVPPKNQIQYHDKIYYLVKNLQPKDSTTSGYIYRSTDGSVIKVEEETVSHIEGSPRNEYLRFSQVYIPKQKVKYEVLGLQGQPLESFLGSQ